MAIRVSALERYEAGRSLLHQADARVKLPVTVAYIFAVTLTPVGHWPALALMAAPLPLAVASGGLSPLLVLRRSALALPRILVATVSFMYRYIFVIAEEALRLMRARDSRSARVEGRKSGGSGWWRAGILGNMVGSLFLRSYERSERVYAAMQARGYDGEPRFLWNPPWRTVEITLGVFVALYAAGIQVYAHY